MRKPDLRSKRLALKPLTKKHLGGPYVGWFNDPVVCAGNSHGERSYTRKEALRYIDRVAKDPSCFVRAIETRDGRHIGNIALQRIDRRSKNAEFAILIGEKEFWGRGYGEEAARLIIRYGFRSLGLERIGAGTFSTNEGMQRLAGKLGMKREGLRRRAFLKNGSFVDVVEFGLLKKEHR